jgi:outer membrane receptor for ferrienterochelin and colicin
MEGTFKINIPETSKTLTFSFVGMKTKEVALTSATTYTVQLDPEVIGVDEVVVTAMGISRDKKALGYAVQNVNSEDLTIAANNNLAGAIQGKVSGVEISPSSGMPGASSKITIRGARSFTGNNTPLYIIDGTPVSSTSDVDTGNSVTEQTLLTVRLILTPTTLKVSTF